jgi:CYTH domain-containing protein
VWEIDEFIDRELVVAEIELPVEDMPVHPPAWLAPHIVREVTGDIEYLNASVARRRRAPRHPGDGENGDPATGTGP